MHKNLKRVIHPNRNLIWAVAIALIATFALVSYIAVTTEQQSAQIVFVELPTTQTFRDSQNGFTARYPNHWEIERDTTGKMITFENPADTTESIVVSPSALSQESTIRRALVITDEHTIQKGSDTVYRFSATSGKDKTPMQVALVKSPTKLYYIHGNSRWFNTFVSNFATK